MEEEYIIPGPWPRERGGMETDKRVADFLREAENLAVQIAEGVRQIGRI